MILHCKKVNKSRKTDVKLELILSDKYKIQCNDDECKLIDRLNKNKTVATGYATLSDLIILIDKGV